MRFNGASRRSRAPSKRKSQMVSTCCLFKVLGSLLLCVFTFGVVLKCKLATFPSIADIISCVEFNSTGELLATGDKGGRIVIFQQEQAVSLHGLDSHNLYPCGIFCVPSQ